MATADLSFVFGPFELFPFKRMLLKERAPVVIGSRAFDLLEVLLKRAGTFVSPAELTSAVWSRRVVDPGTVRVHLAALRKVLDDRQVGKRYVESVPGKGYRFIALVDVRLPPLDGSAGSQRLAAAGWLPAASSSTRPKRLDERTPPVIGREATISDLCDRLMHHRCVTIVGPGGIGKSVVAKAVARNCARQGENVSVIDLSTAKKGQCIPARIGSALAMAVGDVEPVRSLVDALGDARCILLLDNCEHLIGDVAEFADEVLHGAPGVRILATSREPLRIAGEWIHGQGALGVPPQATRLSLDVEQAMTFGAVRLLVERARIKNRHFRLAQTDVQDACDICRRLDGNPLAIGLVAMLVADLPLSAIAQRLDDRWSLLNHSDRSPDSRHRTFRASFDWSYSLLSGHEQLVLARLSELVGPFDLEQALAACVDIPGDAKEAVAVTEAVVGLVSKSLLTLVSADESPKYGLLESLRDYLKD